MPHPLQVAALQDLLVYSIKGLASLAHIARTTAGIEDQTVNTFVNSSIFSTLTNVNFSDARFLEFVTESRALHAQLLAKLAASRVALPASATEHVAWLGAMPHPLAWNSQQVAVNDFGAMMEAAAMTGISARQAVLGDTLAGLQELLTYGLKGLCAYAHHAEALGFRDPKVYADVQEALYFLSTPAASDVGAVLNHCFNAGATNFRVMEVLSNAHTGTFGHPVPTPVRMTPVPGKAILVTGHDMHDLHMLLEQTQGSGINVYTHGEMLPAHGYPGLKRYPHLAGHFGGAWYRQKIEFAGFPGAIAVTTNCVLDPVQAYRDNIFTINETGLTGIPHIKADASGHKDFGPIIRRAQQLPGFTAEDVAKFPPKKDAVVGFGHNAVLSVAPQVVDAIQTGKLDHIFLIGGCDGSEPQRKYYSKLLSHMPTNTMVLTLGCAKFRILDLDFGILPGTELPRLLDMGQSPLPPPRTEALYFLSTPAASDVGAVLNHCFNAGATNFRVMEVLSNAHTGTFGHPVPTPVRMTPVPGKAILVTGHDMHDLHMLLEQTQGSGINVYTHGEMLPAHGYPGLKRYPHLAGHFGGAWYRQKIEFAGFPGAIAVTTNCVLDPVQAYRDNIFTINETGLTGIPHIKADASGHKDFGPIIRRAQQLPGFTAEDVAKFPPKKDAVVGFGHNAVLSVAPQVVDAIQTGKLDHIFLIGGCDGSEPQRKYYSKLLSHMPTNTMVLTLGCAKFRILDLDFGILPGTELPRLLDMGQCNDAYSALVVATELAKVFKTDVNSLPLSLDLSWFEQKAVAVLLTLLHLGVRNIRLGPRLPAFLTPEAVGVLVDRFNLIPANVADPASDMKMMMSCK
ncbi:Hydroxylamine reductase [Tetrabaena socialis]|uniref:Hydroxylamine reductase n=1 Tax=Tetrabaena socialis TaxID=47790 RepID=A0A2J8ABA3_9CHLO|nr:Hydroxylamine reductase [Tetrabaena socialis]|eukprot:PNH09786.1 Hydroxylamine reductase [Tetrabaena socialis]